MTRSKSSSDLYSMMIFPLPLLSAICTRTPERLLQLTLGLAHIGIDLALGLFPFGFGMHQVVDCSLNLPDGHGERDGAVGELENGFRRVQAHQRLGVAEAELVLLDQALHFGGSFSSRMKLATLERSLPVRCAICSWVSPNSRPRRS